MTLNWIVPARRAVVTERCSYSDATSAWVRALRDTPVRDKLIEWYQPMSRLGSDAFAQQYDTNVDRIESWATPFFQDAHRETEHAHAPNVPGSINIDGWWVRLWKGPYRVVKEHEAGLLHDAEQLGSVPPELREVDAGGPLKLWVDVHRRVMNHDAEFVPGDVIEFPIFRLLELCGVRHFLGAHFNGAGSFFLGTSVTDAAGQSPGVLRIHDNLPAMRFQLLLNAACGAFYGTSSGYRAGSELERKSNQKDVEGETVYARGIVYGGSLGDIGRRANSASPAYVLADNHWGDGSNTPTRASLDQLMPSTRLTTAWACTPCALTLANYLFLNRGSWGGGGVNKILRSASAPAAIADNARLRYFTPALFGSAEERSAALTVVHRRAGGTGVPDLAVLRERALRELLGARVREYISEAQRRAEDDRLVEVTLEDDVDEHDDEPPVPDRRAARRRRDRVPPMSLEYDEDATEEEVDVTDVVGTAPLAEHDEADSGDVEELIPVQWGTLLPPNEEIELGRDEMLEFFDGPIHAVGENGHEYSYVRLYKHEKLLEYGPSRDADGSVLGPPLAGDLSAYNPLNGESYYAAPDDRGDLFLFEATGLIMPTRAPGAAAMTVFEMRPTRWVRAEKFYVKCARDGRLQVGEGDAIGLTGGALGHVRSKWLISVASFSAERLRALHDMPASHWRLSLHASATAVLDQKSALHDYPDRAVPFHTVAEANEDEQFVPRSAAQANRRSLADGLGRMDEVLADLSALPWYQREVAALQRRIPALRRAAVRAAQTLVVRLRTSLARTLPPDPGQTRLQPVEERQSFRDRVRALHSDPALAAAAERLRRADIAFDAAVVAHTAAVAAARAAAAARQPTLALWRAARERKDERATARTARNAAAAAVPAHDALRLERAVAALRTAQQTAESDPSTNLREAGLQIRALHRHRLQGILGHIR